MANNLYKIYVTSNNQWEEIELDDLNLSTVFSVEEISDISQRKDNITKTIILKGTKQNNKVLGALYAIDRDVASDAVNPTNLMHNYKPNKYIDCFVLENNVEIIRGKLLVTSIDVVEGVIYYNASIVGTVYSFFSLMSDRKLEELDYFNIPQFKNLTYNKTNIEASWVLPTVAGSEDRPKWFYPMIDYGVYLDSEGVDRTSYSFSVDSLRPAIFTAEYLRAIFRGFRLNSSGRWSQLEDDGVTPLSLFRLESDLITQEWFKRLYIPHNDVRWTKKIFGVSDGGFSNVIYRVNLTTPALTSANKDTQGMRIVNTSFTTGLASPYFSIVPKTGASVNGKDVTAIRVKSPMKATIRITGNVTKSASGGQGGQFFVANGDVAQTEITDKDIIGSTSLRGDSGAGTTTVDLVINNVDISGDLYLGIRNSSDAISFTLSGFEIRVIGSGGSEGTDVIVQYNDTFNLIDAIPKNVSIRDFLKNIMLMFNLYLIVDKDDDTLLRLYTFDQFYNKVLNLDKSVALDWTKKIDWGSYSINTNIDLPRGYTYKYKDDNDIMNVTYKRLWNETYGTRSVLDSSGLVDARTIELMFSPTINYRVKGNIELPVIYEADDIGDETNKKSMKSNIRILYYSGTLNVTGVFDGTFYLIDENRQTIIDGGSVVAFNKFPYSSMNLYTLKTVNGLVDKDDIVATLVFNIPEQSWSTDTLMPEDDELTLYKKHYESQIKELIDVNLVVVDAQAYLNEADINRLDFRIPIYLQSPYGSAYFKLLRVEYNDANTPASIRLQKIVLPDTNIK